MEKMLPKLNKIQTLQAVKAFSKVNRLYKDTPVRMVLKLILTRL